MLLLKPLILPLKPLLKDYLFVLLMNLLLIQRLLSAIMSA